MTITAKDVPACSFQNALLLFRAGFEWIIHELRLDEVAHRAFKGALLNITWAGRVARQHHALLAPGAARPLNWPEISLKRTISKGHGTHRNNGRATSYIRDFPCRFGTRLYFASAAFNPKILGLRVAQPNGGASSRSLPNIPDHGTTL
jgi:hypothetical protein